LQLCFRFSFVATAEDGNLPGSSLDHLLDGLGGFSSFGLGLMELSTIVQNTNKSKEFKRQRCAKIIVADFDHLGGEVLRIQPQGMKGTIFERFHNLVVVSGTSLLLFS
jgi:hypothetical protein